MHMHIKFPRLVQLMFCSIIGRSRLYSYSSWPLSVGKGSPICMISFQWDYLIRTDAECLAQNLGIKQIIEHYNKKQEGRQRHLQECFPEHSAKSVCECENNHSRCVKKVLKEPST